jgi:hypothetical protein
MLRFKITLTLSYYEVQSLVHMTKAIKQRYLRKQLVLFHDKMAPLYKTINIKIRLISLVDLYWIVWEIHLQYPIWSHFHVSMADWLRWFTSDPNHNNNDEDWHSDTHIKSYVNIKLHIRNFIENKFVNRKLQKGGGPINASNNVFSFVVYKCCPKIPFSLQFSN